MARTEFMTKRTGGVLDGLIDALAYMRGDTSRGKAHVVEVPDVDVAQTRKGLNLSQPEFAKLFSVPLPTVRNWEQGRRRPEGPARVLLQVIQAEPEAVLRAIHKSVPAAPKRVSKTARVAKVRPAKG